MALFFFNETWFLHSAESGEEETKVELILHPVKWCRINLCNEVFRVLEFYQQVQKRSYDWLDSGNTVELIYLRPF